MFLVTGAVLAPVGAASAAAPTNDTYDARSVIAAVPYAATFDTSEATTDASDTELNEQCGAPVTDASVWLEYTAAEDGALLVAMTAPARSLPPALPVPGRCRPVLRRRSPSRPRLV
jgi:hypothetical protein